MTIDSATLAARAFVALNTNDSGESAQVIDASDLWQYSDNSLGLRHSTMFRVPVLDDQTVVALQRTMPGVTEDDLKAAIDRLSKGECRKLNQLLDRLTQQTDNNNNVTTLGRLLLQSMQARRQTRLCNTQDEISRLINKMALNITAANVPENAGTMCLAAAIAPKNT
ncbi:MAG: hypothetical protein A2289_01540 [Deltaproteobacteria bacterium RIFOXYA12_FULL_58_15]|nr:MAG: hypothetical protein A2289_01540 [Deltaproteobacteria bacterium RIFOXYA12_FULL_58_15]